MATRLVLSKLCQTFQNPIFQRAVACRTFSTDTIAEGLKLARENQKPIMLIIHRHYCGACKKLMPIIQENADIVSMSGKFVTVEMNGKEEAEEGKYSPDGEYVPRIIFLTSKGEILTNIRNESNLSGQNMFTYTDANDIINSMKRALT